MQRMNYHSTKPKFVVDHFFLAMLLTNVLILFKIIGNPKKEKNLREDLKICKCTKNMGIGGGVSDPVSLDYEWVVRLNISFILAMYHYACDLCFNFFSSRSLNENKN